MIRPEIKLTHGPAAPRLSFQPRFSTFAGAFSPSQRSAARLRRSLPGDGAATGFRARLQSNRFVMHSLTDLERVTCRVTLSSSAQGQSTRGPSFGRYWQRSGNHASGINRRFLIGIRLRTRKAVDPSQVSHPNSVGAQAPFSTRLPEPRSMFSGRSIQVWWPMCPANICYLLRCSSPIPASPPERQLAEPADGPGPFRTRHRQAV